jgi:uncharacterized protein (TIGR02449 family)
LRSKISVYQRKVVNLLTFVANTIILSRVAEQIMSDNILDNFETQIEALIERYERLKQENARLREKQVDLFTQSNAINEKHSLMIVGVKKMIERLKTIEREHGRES